MTYNEDTLSLDISVSLKAGNRDTSMTLTGPVTVAVIDTGAGTATPGVDYVLPSGTQITFPASAGTGSTQTFSLALPSDGTFEPTKTIELALSNLEGPAAFYAGNPELRVQIRDSDSGYDSIQFPPHSVSTREDAGTIWIDVELVLANFSAPSEQAITAEIGIMPMGNATEGEDYVLDLPLQVTFPAGSLHRQRQSIPITIIEDDLYEDWEFVMLTIQTLGDQGVPISPHRMHLNIEDNELAAVVPIGSVLGFGALALGLVVLGARALRSQRTHQDR